MPANFMSHINWMGRKGLKMAKGNGGGQGAGLPSKTGRPSGGGRDNNLPGK